MAELTAKLLEANAAQPGGYRYDTPGTSYQPNTEPSKLAPVNGQQHLPLDRRYQLPAPPTQLNYAHSPSKVAPGHSHPTNQGWNQPQPLNLHRDTEQDTSSEDEERRHPPMTNGQQYEGQRFFSGSRDINHRERTRCVDRRGRLSGPVESELDNFSENRYSDSSRFPRGTARMGFSYRQAHQNRIEKWKLRFSGDQRSVSVENFLYKAKRLADREGIPREILLRDVHMLLEGPASDW